MLRDGQIKQAFRRSLFQNVALEGELTDGVLQVARDRLVEKALDLDRYFLSLFFRADGVLFGSEIGIVFLAAIAEPQRIISDRPTLGDQRFDHGSVIFVL